MSNVFTEYLKAQKAVEHEEVNFENAVGDKQVETAVFRLIAAENYFDDMCREMKLEQLREPENLPTQNNLFRRMFRLPL